MPNLSPDHAPTSRPYSAPSPLCEATEARKRHGRVPRFALAGLLLVLQTLVCGCFGGGGTASNTGAAEGEAGGGLLSRVNPFGNKTIGVLPPTGAVPTLTKDSTGETFSGGGLHKYLGTRARFFQQYGAETVYTSEYSYGPDQGNLVIEVFAMDTPASALGLYQWHGMRKLGGAGRTVPIGAEGVLDTKKEGRNLYFYKGKWFVALIYTGAEPVPDLLPVGSYMADTLDAKRSERPRGFEHLAMDGIEADSIRVTPGNTFQAAFLPPGLTAKAPGAGPIAEVFLITRNDIGEARVTAREYAEYLQLKGKDYTEKYAEGRRPVWLAQDPRQGRVVLTQYGPWVFGVARPSTYREGEAFVDRLAETLRQVPRGQRYGR